MQRVRRTLFTILPAYLLLSTPLFLGAHARTHTSHNSLQKYSRFAYKAPTIWFCLCLEILGRVQAQKCVPMKIPEERICFYDYRLRLELSKHNTTPVIVCKSHATYSRGTDSRTTRFIIYFKKHFIKMTLKQACTYYAIRLTVSCRLQNKLFSFVFTLCSVNSFHQHKCAIPGMYYSVTNSMH